MTGSMRATVFQGLNDISVSSTKVIPMTQNASPTAPRHPWKMRDGQTVVVRPIRPEDEEMMVAFHTALSPDSVYSRYFNVFQLSQRVGHDRLSRVCHPKPGEEAVLVAETVAPTGGSSIVGVGRISRLSGGQDAEFALVVRDSHQQNGLGLELMRGLIAAAGQMGVTRLWGEILAGNLRMQRLCGKVGMRFSNRFGGETVLAELDLAAHPAP